MTWSIGMPVRSCTVAATFCEPPCWMPPSNAELILPSPTPGMFVHRSRGNERKMAFCSSGTVWINMIVSDRFEPPMSAFVPNATCSLFERPARESLPSNR